MIVASDVSNVLRLSSLLRLCSPFLKKKNHLAPYFITEFSVFNSFFGYVNFCYISSYVTDPLTLIIFVVKVCENLLSNYKFIRSLCMPEKQTRLFRIVYQSFRITAHTCYHVHLFLAPVFYEIFFSFSFNFLCYSFRQRGNVFSCIKCSRFLQQSYNV